MTDQTTEPREPDNPAAWALAQHIADHPMSTIQAAFRYLNAPLEVELTEARAVSAVLLPPADQTAFRDCPPDCPCRRVCIGERQSKPPAAVLPAPADQTADRASVLREAADRLSRKAAALTEGLHDMAHFVAKDRLREAEILDREAAELRRMADETQPAETEACPGYETAPNRCACPCEGCKHHCGAHQPAAGARQDGAQR
ncbi:hypothetical protein ABZ400_01975 [Streptomyces sp. NPDC005897]|uniref:hypothetical protein n=1 Tax=Streptomyces sp. NPDC005897 TaxID=3157081 RepID=UPI0033EC5C33